MNTIINNTVQDYIKSTSIYKSYISNMYNNYTCSNLDGYVLAYTALLFQRKWNNRLIIITPTEEIAKELYYDYSSLDNANVIYFPTDGKLLYSKDSLSSVEYNQREALIKFKELNNGIIIFSLRTFLTPKISPSSIDKLEIKIALHDTFDPKSLSNKLMNAGYYRSDNCFEQGSFSIRGEVMDIFPYSALKPIRIYSSWDEIEKIAIFTPETQKTEKTLSKYSLALFDEKEEVRYEAITTYLKENDYYFFIGKERLDVSNKSIINEAKSLYKEAYNNDISVQLPSKMLVNFDEFYKSIKYKLTVFDIKEENIFSFDIGPARSYFGNVTYFKEELENLLKNNYSVNIIAPTDIQKERLEFVLQGFKGLNIFVSSLSHGFSIDKKELIVILDDEIFGRKRVKTKAIVETKSEAIDSFVDLKPMDYVVHIQYGVGQFLKIDRVKTSRNERDYIKIKYSDDVIIYVPIEQANLVQRYIGSSGSKPKLDKIGGNSWTKKKEMAIKKAEEIAGELIRLYAERQNSFGHPFPPDNDWQLQFEASFAFTETADQLKCIEDIKRDMESDLVMDRLICGDVGYGKTEIAFRAVFKAVMGAKQVAFLAPTTILAEQHYRKFLERIGNFPINCAQLSRIIPLKEQKKILNDLEDGKIDVLFGTHKILQKTVKYKNLGLLVIDEEQRFGVKDKEKIKQLKVNVDCLTLSATPIPRTLYMSLLKVRDMSLLTTAPRERLPVKTIITDFNLYKIVDVINKEIARGGQVFFLHNRIDRLEEIAYLLRSNIPSAIIESAHGQMKSNELEDIMHRFVHEGIQVLVSTSIIENGIDIPNVNTIIIDGAQRFGLSQLYQLRGRVGRADKQAYCYLMYPNEEMLNDDAIKRLKVISEHTELGSGFKVAMKDMEIRGAGNILGQEQSGELEAVGLDMYMKILEEEIFKQTGGDKSKKDREVYLELDYTGFIPDTYISDPTIKFELYKKISSVKEEYQLDALYNEMEDRFGPIPDEVENLLSIAQIKAICARLEIYHLSENRGIVQLEFNHLASLNPDKIISLLRLSGGKITLDSKRLNYMKMKTDALSLKDKASYILEQLKRLC